MNDVSSSTGGRLTGLDGLRALAVSAVVVYHLGDNQLPGGFLGVDMFFVISGFLITTLLVSEVNRHGRINLRQFYLRRVRRLFPALLAMLLGTVIIVSTIAPDSAFAVSRDAPAALVYVSNWWAIAQQQSYFEVIGRGNLLGHLWSLAIEEQFYLVWPAIVLLMILLLRSRLHQLRVWITVVGLSGAIVSTWWMWTLADRSGYPIDADPSRVYFGTDTHAMSILTGVALAGVWHPLGLPRLIARWHNTLVSIVGVAALGIWWRLLNDWNEYTESLYRGGFLIASLVMAALIVSATARGSWLGRALDWSPLRWIGERSYGIYLWHFPVFLVTRPGLDLAAEGLAINGVRVAAVVALAAASYRWIETPIRNGAVGDLMKQVRDHTAPRLPRLVIVGLIVTTLSLGNAFLQSSLISPSAYAAEFGATDATEVAGEISGSATPSVSQSSSPPPAAPAKVKGSEVSWYGDSVSLWAQDAIANVLPKFYLNARLNQSPGAMFKLVLAAKRDGTLRPYVVLHLGTGGPISESALKDTLNQLKGRTRIVLVNSTARFSYVKPNNQLLARVAKTLSNVVVADWKSYSAGHHDWFKDGLHCSAKGKPIFAKFVNSVLNKPVS
ncbi:MAG: hypothetical protein RL441_292 [Actinomycetota bacterium]